MATNNRAQPDERERQCKALELRLTGVAYSEIARDLDYADASGAYRAVEAVLKRVESAAAAELRQVEDLRLDALLRRYWPDAIGGDIKAAELVIKLHDRRVKLHGLALGDQLGVGNAEYNQRVADMLASVALYWSGGELPPPGIGA